MKYFIRGYNEFMGGLIQIKNTNQSKLCIIQYEKLVEDVIKELKPCVEFLGFHIDEHLATCIRKDYEGNYHRKPLTKDEQQTIFSNSFSNDELKHYDASYNTFLRKFDRAPISY